MATQIVKIVKNDLMKFRVNTTQKQMIEFMAERNGLSKSAYLLMLATKDFNACELRGDKK